MPDDLRTQRAYADMRVICYQEMCQRAFEERGEGLHDWTCTVLAEATGVHDTLTDTASGDVLATSWLRVPAELVGEAS